MDLTHISLFAGIGGIDLAAEWAGFKTVLMVENNLYCQKVLNRHWPDVPIIGDIRDATKERIMAYATGRQSREQEARNRGQDTSRRSEEETIANSNATGCQDRTEEHRGEQAQEREGVSSIGRRDIISARAGGTDTVKSITLITGGFPCQPVSQAGKRKGKADDRWLWPEMLRVISEVRPTWVIAENVDGLKSMVEWDSLLEVDDKEYTEEEVAESGLSVGEIQERRGRGSLEEILESLKAIGYEVQPFELPACAVNAPHRRDRIFIVGYTKHAGWNGSEITEGFGEGGTFRNGKERQVAAGELTRPSSGGRRTEDVADTKIIGIQGGRATGEQEPGIYAGQRLSECGSPRTGADQWAVEPDVGRVADGISSRVDRLKCLGNAVVPQQMYPILQAIADIEIAIHNTPKCI